MAPPLPVTALSPIAATAFVWRFHGGLRVTVAVKATFNLEAGGAATLRAPADFVTRDLRFEHDPGQTVQRAAELVPYRPRADVTFVGHAYSPVGHALPAMSARLAVFRDGRALVDRTLHVLGSRITPDTTPAPFTRMPLRYERAAASAANPHGCAAGSAPNLVDPNVPARPGGFGPLPSDAPERRALLDALLDPRGPIVEIPTDVADELFQTAPPSQRAPHLRGDEWIVLDGLHPTLPRIQTQLPRPRGAARVTIEGEPRELQLVADTLAIDGDAGTFAVVWRGRFALASEAALATASISAGLELPERPISWPDRPSPPAPAPPAV